MICTQEKGHEGLCTAGEVSGGCKKTAAKWFALEAKVVAEAWQEEVTEGGQIIKVPLPDLPEEAYPEDAVGIPLVLEVQGISPEEMEGSSEQQLAMLYRRHMHPCSRQEAVEWAREVVAARDLGAGA